MSFIKLVDSVRVTSRLSLPILGSNALGGVSRGESKLLSMKLRHPLVAFIFRYRYLFTTEGYVEF